MVVVFVVPVVSGFVSISMHLLLHRLFSFRPPFPSDTSILTIYNDFRLLKLDYQQAGRVYYNISHCVFFFLPRQQVKK